MFIVQFMTGVDSSGRGTFDCYHFLSYRLPSLGYTLYLCCRLLFAFSRVILFKSTVMQASARMEYCLVCLLLVVTVTLEVFDQLRVQPIVSDGVCLAKRPKWIEYATLANVAMAELTSFALFYIP